MMYRRYTQYLPMIIRGNNIVNLVLILFLISCQTYEVIETPKELKGLWFDQTTMDWLIKIDEKTVFWRNKIETIKRVEQYQQNFKIITPTQTINTTLLNDSLSINGIWLTKTFKEHIRSPKSKEQITNRGTVLIQGFFEQIDSASQGSPLKIYVNDFILGDQLEYLTEIDSSGIFRIELEVNGTQDIILGSEHFDHWGKLLVSPGDTLTINVPRSKLIDNIHFAGNNASANYDIFLMNELYKTYIPDYRAVNRALGREPTEYVQFRRAYRQAEQKFLEEYCKERNCTELFKQWFRANVEVEYFSNLMKFSWQSLNYGLGSETRLTGDIKENYEREFMDSIRQDSKLYQLSSSYVSLINGISHRVVIRSNETAKNHSRPLIDFLLDKEVLVSEDEREFLEGFKDSGINTKDLTQSEKEQWWAIEDKFSISIQKFRMKSAHEFFVNSLLRAENKNTKDLLLSQHFYRSILLNRNYEIMDWAFQTTSSQIENESYSQYLKSLYEEIKSQEEQIDRLQLSAMKFDGNGKKLLQKIKRDNPDQAIVIDFWGTWCQPCLKDFEATKDLKAKTSKLKFVYLCVNSSERNWKNVLVKYNPEGDHYLLSQQQTQELLELFNVRSFPTYILIDKMGEIHREIPRPTNGEEFKEYLEKVG